MAAALLQHELASAGAGEGLCVESAGLHALVGHPADPVAQALMQERDLDISAHVARQLTPELAVGFELILAMDARQVAEATALAPQLRGRVHTLGKWSGIEVADPYRQPRSAFEAALADIERGVNDWKQRLIR